MANFHEGGLDMFNSVAYAEPPPSVFRFVEESLAQPTQYISETANAFMSQARDVYESVMNGDAMRIAKAASRQITHQWQRNEIRPLLTTADLQAAPPVMLRWVMAEPTVRNLYHEQRCDGYGDEYVDANPGKVGEEHIDYRQVMNGIVVEDEDGEGWSYTNYYDELPEDEPELKFDEQVDILRTWQSVKNDILRQHDDPTSRWNSAL